MAKEVFPMNLPESELAVAVRLELLAGIAAQVGSVAFFEAVKKAIGTARGRYDVTPLRISEAAGLHHFTTHPAVRAWSFVTSVLHRHVREAPAGGYRLEEYVYRNGEQIVTVPVPEIPDAVKRAVAAIGGWVALKQCEPIYFGQKMKDFRECYSEDRPASL